MYLNTLKSMNVFFSFPEYIQQNGQSELHLFVRFMYSRIKILFLPNFFSQIHHTVLCVELLLCRPYSISGIRTQETPTNSRAQTVNCAYLIFLVPKRANHVKHRL